MTLRISLVTEGAPDQVSGGYLYQRRVADLAPHHDAEIRFVSIPARPYPLGALAARRVLDQVADADVVVVDSLASNTLGPFLARGAPWPLVGSVHQRLGGTEGRAGVRRLRAVADRLAWRRCEHVIVPSEHLAQRLRADGIVGPRLHVVTPGRDIVERDHDIEPPRDLRLGRRLAVVCVGNWVRRKGVLDAVRAVALLPGNTVTLHLVGREDVDHAYRDEIVGELRRGELAGRVVRHGAVSPATVARLLCGADAFVLPSRDEPYGMAYAEAMDAGLPVVGWRAGNLPHMIDDGVEGLLAPVGDVGALATALHSLATDPTGRGRMGAAAAARAACLPTWDDAAGAFVAVCRLAAERPDLDTSRGQRSMRPVSWSVKTSA